ncbi:ADP-ribosylation factor-like protein 2-binding protein [Chytridiales sp. JEL 0842]|nr:ADP-ribosylation factor-like protein 2-binding protein [Chytridiales sp. JEL 0842]
MAMALSISGTSSGRAAMAAEGSKAPQILDLGSSEEDLWDSSCSPSTPEDQLFDDIIGTLEDVLMDEEFERLRDGFMKANYMHFETEDGAENKLIYMDLFQSYTKQVETFLETRLQRLIPGFTMPDFLLLLKNRPDQVVGDVFDMLSLLGDFEEFKDMMVSYKKEKEGTAIDLSGLLAVTTTAGGKGGVRRR